MGSGTFILGILYGDCFTRLRGQHRDQHTSTLCSDITGSHNPPTRDIGLRSKACREPSRSRPVDKRIRAARDGRRRFGPGRRAHDDQNGPTPVCIPLVVFGVQHFLYARFVAALVPSWIPGHLFWAYAVGIAFIATTLSIIVNIKARLAV